MLLLNVVPLFSSVPKLHFQMEEALFINYSLLITLLTDSIPLCIKLCYSTIEFHHFRCSFLSLTSNFRHNSRTGTLKDQYICGHFKLLGYNFRCFVGVPNEMLDFHPFSGLSSVSMANTLLTTVSKQQWGCCLLVHATGVTSLQISCT